jgi:hypothetical protein
MVTHSPITTPELKILVSAVRFRPWPPPSLKHFNRLHSLRSRRTLIKRIHFARSKMLKRLLENFDEHFSMILSRCIGLRSKRSDRVSQSICRVDQFNLSLILAFPFN